MTHANTTPTNYIVKESYREAWGSPYPGESVDMDDIREMADVWMEPVERIMDQVVPALFYRASDECVSETFEAEDMDAAIEIARERWDAAAAEDGPYEVTIVEYASDEDRTNWHWNNWTRVETITVEAARSNTMTQTIEPTMHTYRNNNDAFGMTGPFVAVSKEAIADEMHDAFMRAATDDYLAMLADGEPGMSRAEYVAETVARVRAEFIAGLEEVRFYTASCDHEFLAFEASSMDAAIEHISDTWGYARPEPFDVTITEYPTAEAREVRHIVSTVATDRRTITVAAK